MTEKEILTNEIFKDCLLCKKWVESEIRELENLLEAVAVESERKWLKERLEEYKRKLKQLDAFREWYLLNDFERYRTEVKMQK